jgi:hypothetical protein
VSPLKRSLQHPLKYDERLGPSRLYLDDLEDLLSYLHDAVAEARADMVERIVKDLRKRRPSANSEELEKEANELVESRYKVELRAGEAVAEKVEDLRDATPGELNELSITCSRPGVAILLTPRFGHANGVAATDDDGTRNIVEDVARFFRARRTLYVAKRFLTRMGISFTFVVGPVSVIASQWLSTDHNWSLRDTVSAILILLLGPALILTDQLVVMRRSGGVAIIPERRKDVRVISGQTRRDIGIAVLGAAVGGFLGIAGTLIADAVSK